MPEASRLIATTAALILTILAIWLTTLAYTNLTTSSTGTALDTWHEQGTAPKATDTSKVALKYYQKAINAVPSWPYYWAGVIQTKHALWQYDDEMNLAIQNAARYGPWFANNQNIILLAGIQGWPYLTPEAQAAVTQILENALQLQPKMVIKQSLDHGYSAYILPIINKDETLKDIYKDELKYRKRKLKN